MWLPSKEELVPTDTEIDDGCCNHPVVVLSTVPRAAKVDILIITSLGGLDLEAKYPNRPSARQDHLPIAPSKAHPDNGKLLFLKDPSYELRKRSYVKTKNRHTILLASLQPYNRHGPEVFLSRQSYKVLVRHIQYSETVEEPLLVTSRHEQVHSDSPRHHVRRPIAAEDVLFIMQYMRAAHERERRRDSTYHVPRNYSNAPLGNERRPLLSREDRRSRPYGGRPVLPITHPIREGYGSDASKPFDWANFRNRDNALTFSVTSRQARWETTSTDLALVNASTGEPLSPAPQRGALQCFIRMDPLSVIASIAGVSTAGIALSRAIYDIVSSVRNAPKEASDIARGLCDLSLNLRELRRVLKGGQDICRRSLIKRVASSIKRVSRIQDEIEDLLDITGKGVRLRWLFRKSKIQGLLYAIESHKTGINLILQTMTLAVQLKQVSKDKKKTSTDNSQEKEESWNEVELVRQQAENMVEMSYHSIRELTSDYPNSASQSESEEAKDMGEDSNKHHIQKYENRDGKALDSAAWLYDVVFSAATAKRDTEPKQRPACGVVSSSRPRDSSEELEGHVASVENQKNSSSATQHYRSISTASTQALVARCNSPSMQLETLTRRPPAASLVVDVLLSEWTTLTEVEMAATGEGSQEKMEAKVSNDEEQMLKFTDAVGRKFAIPFRLAGRWENMEDIIDEMFLHVDELRAYVKAGSYDILDAAGNTVSRSAWQDAVRPGERYRMAMWPIRDKSTASHSPKESFTTGAKVPSSPREKKKKIKTRSANKFAKETALLALLC
ncbi:hypothetical protein NPX13_g303 [Xylaria arbuscula]|uniref:Ubiquitin-like domain-containing protein n=1 Tax=Xylaria arbuscula TaxID=114810 RepID=A0A9W8TS08_9PEZI|nr:hypothetical protein NPX13_g303 [Xylaria arbuscula]